MGEVTHFYHTITKHKFTIDDDPLVAPGDKMKEVIRRCISEAKAGISKVCHQNQKKLSKTLCCVLHLRHALIIQK